MELMSVVGLVAALCTTSAFVPQALKTWRTRCTKDLSLGMYSLFVFGISLWLIYGIAIADAPLIAANAITLVLSGSILYLKIRNG